MNSGDEEFRIFDNVTANASQSFMNATNNARMRMRRGPTPSGFKEDVMTAALLAVTAYLCIVTCWYQANYVQKRLAKTNRLCVAVMFTLLFREIAFELELRLGNSSTLACNICQALVTSLGAFNRIVPFIVLWFRQRGIYRGPTHSRKVKRLTKYIGIASLVFVGLVVSINALLLIILGKLSSTRFGCIPLNVQVYLEINNALSPVYFGSSVVIQLTMLGLVLYPIVNHHAARSHGPKGRLKRTVVRLALCTSVCVLSDVIFLVLRYVRTPGNTVMTRALFSCFDDVIKIVAVLCSFANFPARLFPMFFRKTSAEARQTSRRTSVVNTVTTRRNSVDLKTRCSTKSVTSNPSVNY
ncbi:unnamed protein product [Clavelina lepadiformis]|uniref:G-protein coupled receptors family 1 profile domain-containing protein n=1 Tax=Clavelina lepadiformis TaxID=159417 RepID=A0ABP0F4A2_CLALP